MANSFKKKDIKYDPTNFNKNFEATDNLDYKLVLPGKKIDNIEIITLPHKEPIEKIILDIRDLFFQILNLVEEKENPLPYIFSSDKRQFTFSLFLIIFGTLLLLLASLMKSPSDKH